MDDLIPRLRDSWVNNHSEVRDLERAITEAQEKARNPEWDPDPIAFCKAGARAATAAEEATRFLAQKKLQLSEYFDKQIRDHLDTRRES